MNFYLSLDEGNILYKSLRSNLSGFEIPHYVVDLPEGKGKVIAENTSVFTNHKQETIKYHTPYGRSLT